MQFISELEAAGNEDRCDIAVLECTASFDYKTGLAPLTGADGTVGKWDLVVLRFGPPLLGIPSNRGRLYMILTRREVVMWHRAIDSYGHAEAFSQLFSRDVVTDGGIYFRAPESEILQYVEGLAAKRHLPPRTASGRPWKLRRVLAPCLKRSIERHREAIAAGLGGGEFPDVFVNLRQRPGHTPVAVLMPTLLRGSVTWSFRRNRPLMALEVMETLGYGMYAEPSSARASFADAVADMTESQVRCLAGNGMHAAAVGSVLMFVLAGTRIVLSVD